MNPSSLNFVNVPVGRGQTQSVTLANLGGPKVTITQVNVSGTGFTLTGQSFPLTLSGGQSVACSVTFTPQAAGSSSGSISFAFVTQGSNGKGNNNSSGTTYTVSLSGTAVSSGQLASSASSVQFASVQVGSSQTQSETLTNVGTSNVTISQVTTSGLGFSVSPWGGPVTLAPGQAATLNITFAPASSGTVSGNLAIASNASNASINVPLSGTGMTPPTLTPNPSSINFNTVPVGGTGSQFETLTNSGGSSLSIIQVAVSGTGFNLTGLSLPQALAPGQSVTFTVSFAPTTAGTMNGTLALTSNASNPNLNIALTGTGSSVGQLATNPSSLSFGSVVVGTSTTQTGTLMASGAGVTVSSVSSSSSEFAVSGISVPMTLAAGQSVPFTVTFTPQTSGAASANISFLSNASDSTLTEAVAGSGTAPIPHSASLSWNASTSVVTGYNIYRSGNSGGPYTKMNSVLESTTGFIDSSVQAGQTYYYVTTAVDSAGLESAYSNQVQAVIPSP